MRTGLSPTHRRSVPSMALIQAKAQPVICNAKKSRHSEKPIRQQFTNFSALQEVCYSTLHQMTVFNV
jgi:hypothetical protein